MTVILSIINLWGRLNAALLWAGRVAGASAVALMVFIIMLQVIFRYLLDASLAWPEEGARFLMLWMTGLMAPSALRRGGFVSINILIRLLPRMAALEFGVRVDFLEGL
jgi:TRAP-type C4-dicarboxylate transport system permease small subunit